MARRELAKDDLLREATALVERIELAPLSLPQSDHITAGFRADGAVSIFFGDDPVYHFNALGELRRAYCEGRLIKASQRRLESLSRVRQPGEVQLVRHELSDAEQSAFLIRMQELLESLAAFLNRGECRVVGQVPAEADIVGRLQVWLAKIDCTLIAASPHAEPHSPHRQQ